ncbi:predicted protein [Sparassis crispa]|uniref:ABC transporter domain-containing protein n=1 Tax=Sparassis crispa TaxID=139825 RepID=A0A401GBR1_9APHY|nr:predicted protein [Sparassis crispa]GBE79587.1 predicted protein [Sparassis crispa]
MLMLDLTRGVFPAFRGYSQALLIDEIQHAISSGNFTGSRLSWLLFTELVRLGMESCIDSFASSNEDIVHNSTRFLIEFRLMEKRMHLDVPTLADPLIRDLLHESELFVRSFNGMSSFGLFSVLDLTRIVSLASELVSHVLVLSSLASGSIHIFALLLPIISSLLPLISAWFGRSRTYMDDLTSPLEARTSAKQEKMRLLAHSDPYRPEILLFGLGPWILRSWARARKLMLGLERQQSTTGPQLSSVFLSQINVSGLLATIQNIPLILALQYSSTSLGSFTLYRSSIQSLFLTASSLLQSIRLTYQGIFLMGAFCAAMEIEPRLCPKTEAITYRRSRSGMRLEAKDLSFTYPGCREPTLRNINLTVDAGETLAIVGFNGSGKSTLANILLRILEFDSGSLFVNGADIRKYRPEDYHTHVTAVFQGFSKFSATAKENIGVGRIEDMNSSAAIDSAIRLAGAREIVYSLPQGLRTKLDTAGHDPSGFTDMTSAHAHHGLSGGEWQRIAISRAFMRAHRPEVELLLLDEPTSSLDAHAQNWIFESIEKISCLPNGERTKTVIFITHRLSTARRADKIAMMENGTVSEFGTHQELLKRDGTYAALYRAST